MCLQSDLEETQILPDPESEAEALERTLPDVAWLHVNLYSAIQSAWCGVCAERSILRFRVLL